MLLWNPPQFLVENIKWVHLSSFTYFHAKRISPLILKLTFNDTNVKLLLELTDESFRFAFVNALIYVRLNQSETFDLLTSFQDRSRSVDL